MTAIPSITLNDGVEIPQLGFGVWQVPPADVKVATQIAIEVGYRHIDTAEMYGNEVGVGEAVRESGLDRSEIFVTSKLNNGFHDPAQAMVAFEQSLSDLNIGYLDLFLIHWPMPLNGDFVATWKALEAMKATGKVRSIGVSNFLIHHLERVLAESDTVPSVNQIEVHPYLTQEPLRAFNTEHSIVTEAWSPLASGKIIGDAAISAIADRIGKSVAQVTLRWHLQRGDIIFPKSVTRSRIQENIEIFDFELAEADMLAISALNRDERTGPNPDDIN